ncbi:GmrSD restriction endonuclease domain-containing protein [Companilactobacillus sp. DQM5]|uniref:GmrSD restriction endonuclease domain-containing protein n=1 Tax=Companilactobacillus sp. DQM5 TaxID=3463359 RepID=UPI004059DC90
MDSKNIQKKQIKPDLITGTRGQLIMPRALKSRELQKKLNIIASNNYFTKKQESYQKSKIEILLNLSKEQNDWGLDKIRERDIRISDEFFNVLRKWGLNRVDIQPEEALTPIPDKRLDDYQSFIKMFKLEDSNKSRDKFLKM